METQQDPSKANKGALLGASISLETFLHKGMHCRCLQGLGRTLMASRLSGVLGNAGCQEAVSATDWETQVEVFPGRSPGVLVMLEHSQKQE